MDPEARDANSLLVELDRGLQSPNINDQCDAVIRFTTLFKKYPMPLLVNSAFLKLAEAFRVSSNIIRVQICEILEINQNHLKQIHNIDDLYRSLFAVTTSNDPIARSIALLALGHIAPIVGDYRGVHHCISSSLDTSVEFELTATIICAASYVKHSAEFACNIYPRIVSIIDSGKFPISTKIRALSVLDHGFYNANDAMTVRSFLIDVIEKTNLKKLICACLTLSTKISYNSLSHIVAQIELLLKIFQDDPKEVVKACALKNLLFLAEKSPHIWESSHVDPLVFHLEQIALNAKSIKGNHSVGPVLSIFCKLLTCKCNFIMQHEKNRIFTLCYKFALSDSNLSLCSMAFELLTVKSEEHYQQASKNVMECPIKDETADTLEAIKAFLIQAVPQKPSSRSKAAAERLAEKPATGDDDVRLKSIYRHIVKLCSLNHHYCSEILKLVFDRISSKNVNLACLSGYYTELMCAISQYSDEFVLTPESCLELINTKHADVSEKNILNLCVLYFQTMRMNLTRKPKEHQQIIHWFNEQNRSDCLAFKVMRQAMRYGHFGIALQLCDYLRQHVVKDTIDFYLKSLEYICRAELQLATDPELDEKLDSALDSYEEAVSPLRASVSASKTTNFQLQFIWLRIRMLQLHADLRKCCKHFELIHLTRKELLFANSSFEVRLMYENNDMGAFYKMIKISKEYRTLADCYENLLLILSSNCDPKTLSYIQMLKSSCLVMADVIDSVFHHGKNNHLLNKLTTETNATLEHKELERVCNKLWESIKDQIIKPGIPADDKPLSPYISLIRSFSTCLLGCSFSFPRRFFQMLEPTPSM